MFPPFAGRAIDLIFAVFAAAMSSVLEVKSRVSFSGILESLSVERILSERLVSAVMILV